MDFLISGYDESDQSNIIIIELKQWDKLNAIDGMEGLVETYLEDAPAFTREQVDELRAFIKKSVVKKGLILGKKIERRRNAVHTKNRSFFDAKIIICNFNL